MYVSGQFHPWPLYPRERNPGAYLVGGWVDPWASLHAAAKRKISATETRIVRPQTRQYTDYSSSAPCMVVFIFPNSKFIILSGLFNNMAIFSPTAQQPLEVQGLLISDASR